MLTKLQTYRYQAYLDFEKKSSLRHELVDGHIFVLTDPGEKHNQLVRNVYNLMLEQLDKESLFCFDLRVRIEATNRVYYPDIVVVGETWDIENYITRAPVFIAEVLTPATELIDRREKFKNYQKSDYFQEYLLISHETILLEHYCKAEDGDWYIETLTNQEENLQLQTLAVNLSISEIYRGIL